MAKRRKNSSFKARSRTPRRDPLTSLQKRCLRALEWYWGQYGGSPTQKELSSMLRLKSGQGCRSLLRSLEKKGYILIKPNSWRGIQLHEDLLQAARVRKLEQLRQSRKSS
jgi:SOS-response transcriptional repressor LexA